MDPTPLHQNSGAVSGAVSGTPVAVALAGADTTADSSTLVACFTSGGTQTISAAPSGWVRIGPAGAGQAKLSVFRRGPVEGLVAGESTWSFTPFSATAAPLSWVVLEWPGLDPDAPVDVVPVSLTETTTGTTLTSTAPLDSTYDGLAVSVAATYLSTSATPDSLSGHTGGFVELLEQSANDGVSKSVDLSVAVLPVAALGSYGPTVTVSRTLVTASPGAALTFVLNALGSRKAADVAFCFGGEICTEVGITTGTSGSLVADAVTGSPAVVYDPGNVPTGNGCVEINTTAAAEYIRWGTATLGTSAAYQVSVLRFWFPGSLPGADVELYAPEIASATAVSVTYRTASQKIGVKVGSGTEQLSANTVVAGTVYRVDLRVLASTTAATADWQVDGVAQAQATGTTSGAAVQGFRLGPTVAATVVVRFDDLVVSKVAGHYPLGDMHVIPLKVDPAGTPSISGTAANFGVMTANGTVAAWDATNARNAVDDVPPDLTATRDAAVAVTASATDYAEFPMQTYDAAANGAAIRGVKAYFCLWAASALAATIRLLAYDGVTTYTLFSEADPNADNTATPVWVAKMVRGSTRPDWTQAKLDALVLRFGSNDATPDIGVDAMLVEVAVVMGAPAVQVASATGIEGATASATVNARLDPDSGAVIAYDATPPADRDAVVDLVVRGTPSTVTVPAGTPTTQVVGADTVDDVTHAGVTLA